MPSTETGSRSPQRSLREFARDCIRHGALHDGLPPRVDPLEHPAAWRERRACFVTLHKGGALRGCIGSLEATQSLVEDVARNACRAAFHDPRFVPVQLDEIPLLEIEISALEPSEPLPAASEAELLAKLRPGVDGLILQDGVRSATFLPAVWASLPEPRDFLWALEHKAGLPAGHWSPTLRFRRYRTQTID